MVNRESERKRLVEVISQFERTCPVNCTGLEKSCTQCVLEQKADHLLDNGIVVPPVKVGQKVYLVRSLMNDVIEGEVTSLKTTEFSRYTVVFLIDDNRYTEIPFEAYGETVFTSRKEAKKALKGVGRSEISNDKHTAEMVRTYSIRQENS